MLETGEENSPKDKGGVGRGQLPSNIPFWCQGLERGGSSAWQLAGCWGWWAQQEEGVPTAGRVFLKQIKGWAGAHLVLSSLGCVLGTMTHARAGQSL